MINDDGIIRLYYGACCPFASMPSATMPFTRMVQSILFGKSRARIKAQPGGIQGAITIELEDDMLTVRGEPARIIPENMWGTSFAEHSFWEASSIRKVDDTYYFVYSSVSSHELCYATSQYPDRDFVYRGTVVSNGDVGFEGRAASDRTNHTGTNHGGMERIGSQWYIFYHRNTHSSIHRRQACAEPITIEPDGSINQVPVSSNGLNNEALPADRRYPAAICSMLTNGRTGHGKVPPNRHPKITHDASGQFVSAVAEGTIVGFRSFLFEGPTRIMVTVRGTASGRLARSTGLGPAGSIQILPSREWEDVSTVVSVDGRRELSFRFSGEGQMDLLTVSFTPGK